MSRHVTVELDVVVEPLGARARDADDVAKDMSMSPSYVDPDTDRTSCCVAEEVWFEDEGYHGCDACRLATRPLIQYEIVLTRGPNGWPLIAFHGPVPMVEAMLEKHGYEDGLDTYAIEYEDTEEETDGADWLANHEARKGQEEA